MKKRVLVVEDDSAFAEVLCHYLENENFKVLKVADGQEAVGAAVEFKPDLVLLDLALPGKSGFELCSAWQHQQFPIIIVTAKSLKEDELRGFEAGADDYITKPFDLQKLVARMNAALRRTQPSVQQAKFGNVTIDFERLEARRGNHVIELTHQEYTLVRYLAERANHTVSRVELLQAVWGFLDTPYTRSVDMAINRLRKKLEVDPHHPRFLRTTRGGYLLATTKRQ